jgi:hypothetical protein
MTPGINQTSTGGGYKKDAPGDVKPGAPSPRSLEDRDAFSFYRPTRSMNLFIALIALAFKVVPDSWAARLNQIDESRTWGAALYFIGITGLLCAFVLGIGKLIQATF